MSFYFLDSTARSAWLAATSQQAQLEALAALWSGNVSARFYSSASTHLATVTYGTPTIDTGSTPRAMVLGAWSAESHYNPGTAAYCVLAVPAGADILRADVSLAGAITDPGGRTRLDIGSKLRIEATASLPIGTALENFAATVSAGTVGEFSSTTLNTTQASGSRPFEGTAAAVAASLNPDQLLDWASMMDYEPTTRRYFISGGRPSTADVVSKLVLKLVMYDEIADEWSSVDQWAGATPAASEAHCGHLYRATTVLTQHQLMAYSPHNYDTAIGRYIYLWDIAAQEYWGRIPAPPANIAGYNSTFNGDFLCWFPTLGTSGGLVCADPASSRVIWFDWADRANGVSAWKTFTPQNLGSAFISSGSGGTHFVGHYHPVEDAMIVWCSYGEYPAKGALIQSDGTMALTEFAAPSGLDLSTAGGEGGPFVPHPTASVSIAFDRQNGHIWSYDWTVEGTGVSPWTDRGAMPTELTGNYTVALPHPTGGGFLFAKYGAAGASTAYYWKPGF